MSQQTIFKKFIAKIGRLPIISPAIRQPSVRSKIEKIAGGHLLYGSGWDRIHPFDRYHGTDTSGVTTTKKLPATGSVRAYAIGYAGSQPNVLRLALAQLPALDSYTFIDLGCGKGRALLVASEFLFQDIIGVELSSPLAEITKRNAAIMSQRFPRRTPVGIVVGDASNYPLPSGNLVIFLYNPFKAELIATVVAGIEAALAAESRSIYVIYYNPIAGHCFDASQQLERSFAQMLPYADSELGYGPDHEDPVVIWQGGTAPRSTDAHANAQIVLEHESRVSILSV